MRSTRFDLHDPFAKLDIEEDLMFGKHRRLFGEVTKSGGGGKSKSKKAKAKAKKKAKGKAKPPKAPKKKKR